jgi:hypothetical protein
MSNLLEHLNRETFPPAMIEAFIQWCIWEQARPALVTVLQKTGLDPHALEIMHAKTYTALAQACQNAGMDAHEARKRTGPLGLSTAEASAFLVQRITQAATEADWDPEGIAFYSAQVMGWAGFAEAGFADPRAKSAAESAARHAQETKLNELWAEFGTE